MNKFQGPGDKTYW